MSTENKSEYSRICCGHLIGRPIVLGDQRKEQMNVTMSHQELTNKFTFASKVAAAFAGVAVLPNGVVLAAAGEASGRMCKGATIEAVRNMNDCTVYAVRRNGSDDNRALVLIEASDGETTFADTSDDDAVAALNEKVTAHGGEAI